MIKFSEKKKIVGFIPQVSNGDPSIEWSNENYIENFKLNKAPLNVLVPRPILYKSAKLTDLLSASLVGLTFNILVSKKLNELLLSGESFSVQSFETLVLEKDLKHPYNIIHFYDFGWDSLNLELTEIVKVDDVDYSETKILVNTSEELKSLIENQNIANGGRFFYKITKPVFKNNFNYDFFKLRGIYGGTGIFVSDKIKLMIEEEKCNGIEFV